MVLNVYFKAFLWSLALPLSYLIGVPILTHTLPFPRGDPKYRDKPWTRPNVNPKDIPSIKSSFERNKGRYDLLGFLRMSNSTTTSKPTEPTTTQRTTQRSGTLHANETDPGSTSVPTDAPRITRKYKLFYSEY